MRLGQPYLSYAPGIDPASPYTGSPIPLTVQKQLRSSLAIQSSTSAFHAELQGAAADAGQTLTNRSRSALYAQITAQLAALQPLLALPSGTPASSSTIAHAQAAGSGTDSTIASGQSLNLGTPGAGQLGPTATLQALASQLGLRPGSNGSYSFAINGKAVSFTPSATLNDVLAGINRAGAGVLASYDAASRKVVLTAQTPGAIPIQAQDTAGNLVSALKLTTSQAQAAQGTAPQAAAPAPAAPSPTLSQLSRTSLLQSAQGQYRINLNGVTLGFSANETAAQVVQTINASGAGVQASFNANNGTFALTPLAGPAAPAAPNSGPTSPQALIGALTAQATGNTAASPANPQPSAPWLATGGAPITGSDLAGNFLSNAIQQAPSQAVSAQNPATAQALGALGSALGNLVSLLNSATSGNAAADPLTTDLNDALSGLIRPSGQGLQTLGDIGFSLQNGKVSFDAQTFNQLAASQPNQVNSFLSHFLSGPVQSLANSATQAIADQQAQMPLEQSLAAQDVHVRGEMARMQYQQQSLLFEQVNFEKQQAALKDQQASMASLHKRLNAQDQPDPTKTAPQQHAAAASPAPTPAPPAAVPPAAGQGPSAAPGVLSFGLSR